MSPRDEFTQKKVDEIINGEFPKYKNMLERCFDFKQWGFKLVFLGDVPESHPSIVYESDKCRVRFMWEIPDIRDSNEITYILYGRLHAPIDQDIMLWNGERCYCWHDIKQVLNFLDGLSPQEAFKNYYAPLFMYDFFEKNKTKGWRQSEFQARRQAAVWKHYGHRLFDLFDVRHPDLWAQYASFLKEFYRTGTESPENSARPPLYKIC